MRQDNRLIEAVIMLFLFFMLLSWASKAWSAETVDVERLATSIRRAENNVNYGILKHIKGNNYRLACIQTINHALRDWDGRGDFISFLGSRYCPIGASNDPHNLNKNWVSNVKYFYLTNKSK